MTVAELSAPPRPRARADRRSARRPRRARRGRGSGARGARRYVATPEFETFRAGSIGRVTRAGIRSDHLQSAEALSCARSGSCAPAGRTRSRRTRCPGRDGRPLPAVRRACAALARGPAGCARAPGRAVSRCRRRRRGDQLRALHGLPGGLGRMPGAEPRGPQDRPRARPLGRPRGADLIPARRRRGADAVGRYDLAIIPQPFLSPAAFELGIERIGAALRPGGWMLVLALDVPVADPVAAAASSVPRSPLGRGCGLGRRADRETRRCRIRGGAGRPAGRRLPDVRRPPGRPVEAMARESPGARRLADPGMIRVHGRWCASIGFPSRPTWSASLSRPATRASSSSGSTTPTPIAPR